MTVEEFFGDFSRADYARSIQNLSEDQLRCEHSKIRSKVIAARSATTVSGASLLHTVGFSAIGVGIGYRKQRYNKQKQDVIEALMRQNGWPISPMTAGAFLVAAGPAAIAGAIAPGAEHFLGHVAGHGAAAFTAHHAHDTISAAAHHTGDFVHAVENGASSQAHAVYDGLVGHATQLVPIDTVATNTPEFLGYVAGQGAANALEMVAVKEVVKRGTKAFTTIMVTRTPEKNDSSSHRTKTAEPSFVSSNHQTFKETKAKSRRGQLLDKTAGRTATTELPEVDAVLPRKTSRNTERLKPDEVKIGPFIFLLLPPLINDIVGLQALHIATLAATIHNFFVAEERWTIKNFLWSCLSLYMPAINARINGTHLLWYVTCTAELVVMDYAIQDEEIITPSAIAVVGIALLRFFVLFKMSELGNMVFGLIAGSLIISLLQYKRGFASENADSIAHLSCFHWKRPEYVFIASGMFWYCDMNGPLTSWMWIGSCLASALVSIIQFRARWVHNKESIWILSWLWFWRVILLLPAVLLLLAVVNVVVDEKYNITRRRWYAHAESLTCPNPYPYTQKGWAGKPMGYMPVGL